ncbi:MAG: M4 family metallopeptidase [Dyadobacter sp.]|uniref:M4 family metallopeptidase n=1 Tax=Dyadobacter sp. TaxID=1914288 RepID=UPI001B0A822A|nr:M4 family metallopeptidase [Dyadobacter sp.]MBO9613417.1 M4 family metallopeptidase [Dyadobacter sp.]
MKKTLLTLLGIFVVTLRPAAFSQTLNNAKNVDRTAMSHYNGLKTFRALEYTISPDPLSEKIYRLQTLPENGFPAIQIYGTDNASTVFFEDKTPYDNAFTDNPTPYLSTEAVQLYFGFQTAMKIFDQRFGWKGMDGTDANSVKISIENSDGTSNDYSYARFSGDISTPLFRFGKSFVHSTPLPASIDIVSHELSHAIMKYRSNIAYLNSICSEYRSIDEGLADVFGIYAKNKFLQSTPQNYNWLVAEEILSKPKDMSNPKSYDRADTYKGEHFDNGCSDNYNYDAGAGVVTKWFYLLSSGFAGSATNDLGYQYSNLTGIGVEKAIQIVWDAIPKLKAYSDYPAFKAFTLDAVTQLYGLNSMEYQAVEKAWCAVGVCDNNLPFFSIYPANASSNIEPWPAVKVNFSWDNDPRVKEVEVQMASDYNFTNPQVYKVSTFDTFFKPGGGVFYKGSASGYFRPDETVYVRAKITQADANFCKGLNPLCKLYQQFGPTHAVRLDNKKAEFWPANISTTVKPWYAELTWKSVKDAELYLMQVASDPSFNSIIYEGFAPHTGNFTETGLVNATLVIGQTYYARVAAKRLDKPKLQGNYGRWSKPLIIKTSTPSTSVIQAKTQKLNDPPTPVGSLGRLISWDPVPGATGFVVEVAKDNAFTNIVSSTALSGNSASTIVLFPPLPNLTSLFVRVLPKNNLVFGICSNIWRIIVNETAALPVMTGPANGTTFPFKDFAGKVFEWNKGTLNLNTVDHFELHLTKPSGPTSIFSTQGKTFNFFVQDPLLFDGTGLQASVLAVNALGAKTGLSLPFNYPICPDHPAVFFPGDLGKVDPTKDFKVEWFPSQSFPPGSQFLVTIKENGINAVPGFTDKPTTANFMLVPAGTLANGKNYTVTVRNSSSCPALPVPAPFFSAVGSGGSNQPQPPKLVDFTIELKGFRNDLDGLAWETSDYTFAFELIDEGGNILALLDPNMMPVTQLLVDSENSGVIMEAKQKPEGKYKLRLKMFDIVNPLDYYPFDQPRFSVLLNGQPVVSNHVITVDFVNPNSPFHEWKVGFEWEIILDIK